MELNPIQLTLLDGIETENFGYIRFLTVEDLLFIGEKNYKKIMSMYSMSKDLYELSEEFKDFDLFFIRFSDGKYISFEDGSRLIDILIDSLCLIYGITKDSIVVNEDMMYISFKSNNKHILLYRENYDEFCKIILDSNMFEKTEKEEEVKYAEGTSEDQIKRHKEFLRYAKAEAERNAVSLEMIINIMLAKLKLYSNKKELRSMTIYNLMYAYYAETIEENYYSNFKQYLAGAEANKLDLKHWTTKLIDVIIKRRK